MKKHTEFIGKILMAAYAVSLIVVPASAKEIKITAHQIYTYAVQKNEEALAKLANIDLQDEDGVTAYCLARKGKNDEAKELLEKHGADKDQKCPNILAIAPIAYGAAGVLAAGGLVALAAGGGGGGSSKVACIHGTVEGKQCVCNDGWTGSACDEIAGGYIQGTDGESYPELDKSHGCVQTNEFCDSCAAGWAGKTCEEIDTDNNYKEGTDGQPYPDLHCQNGGTQPLDKCECPTGWAGDVCEKIDTDNDFKEGTDGKPYPDLHCQNGGTQPLDKCECPAGWTGDVCEKIDTDNDFKEGTDGKPYPDLHCQNGGTQPLDKCECPAGWTGDVCETEATCEPQFKEGCAVNEYTKGGHCKRGNTDLIDCFVNSDENCVQSKEDEDYCLACKENYYVENGKCHENNVEHCAQRSTTANKCLVCAEGWASPDESGKCSSCDYEDYFGNGSSCTKRTNKTCTTYDVTTDTCTACKSDTQYLKDGVCGNYTLDNCATKDPYDNKCKSCNKGEYLTANGTCEENTSANCQDKSTEANSCNTCNTGWVNKGGVCNTCDWENYYGDGTTTCALRENKEHCATYNNGSDTCATCDEGYLLVGGACNTACVTRTHYGDGKTCTPRNNRTCKTYNMAKDECEDCYGNQYLADGVCNKHTHNNCGKYDLTDDRCLTCNGNDWYDKEDGTCHTHSSKNCGSYDLEADKCLSCQGNDYLASDGTCKPHTNNNCGSYNLTADECLSCTGNDWLDNGVCKPHTNNNCGSYDLTDDRCLSCQGNDWLDEDNGTCNSHEKNNNCGSYDLTADKCLSCQGNDYLTEDGACKKHTKNNCGSYDLTADRCSSCKGNDWLNEEDGTCNTHTSTDCGSYDLTADRCLSCQGNNYLTKDGTCEKHTSTNCYEYDLETDRCLSCQGIDWLNEEDGTCNTQSNDNCLTWNKTANACATCHYGEYLTERGTCETNDTPHCETLSTTSKTCEKCATGWANPDEEGQCSSCERNTHFGDGNTCTPRGNKTCNNYTETLDRCDDCNGNDWLDASDGVCKTHDSTNCDEYDLNANKCKSCYEPNYLTEDGRCVQNESPHCANLSTEEQGKCVVCQTGWAEPVNGICNTCVWDDYFGDGVNTCEKRTNKTCSEAKRDKATDRCLSCDGDDYLEDSDGKCYPRVSNCDTQVEDKCTDCTYGWYLEDGQCPKNESENCATLSKTANECATCSADDRRYLNNGQCVENNTPNCSVTNTTSETCDSCATGWKSTSGVCDTCDADNGYTGSACTECLSGYYWTGSECEVQEGIRNCKESSTTQANWCDECNTGWQSPTDGQCTQCVWDDYYGNPTTVGGCKPRQNKTCSPDKMDKATDRCLSCDDGEYLEPSDGKCYPTVQNCTTQVKDKCTVCEYDYYLEDGQCPENTTNNCDKKSITSNGCESCKAEDRLYLKGDQCVANETPNCTTTSTTSNTCVECNAGWVVDNPQCDTCVLDTHYGDGETCTPRENKTCKTYEKETDKCKTCPEGKWLDSTDGVCKSYEQNTNCAGYDPNADRCTSCNYDEYWYDTTDGACIEREKSTNCNAVYNYADKCVSCNETEWFDSSTELCITREKQHCATTNKNADECLSCEETNVYWLDRSTGTCTAREDNTNCATFVEDADKCSACKATEWFNQEAGTCTTRVDSTNCASTDLYADKCTACNASEWFNQETSLCITREQPNCATTDLYADKCTACTEKDDLWLNRSEGTCNERTNNPNCAAFVEDADKCTSCTVENDYLTTTGDCTPRDVNKNCATFVETADKCATCEDKDWLNVSEGSCNEREKENCATTDPNADKCTSCVNKDELWLDTDEGACKERTNNPNCVVFVEFADKCESCTVENDYLTDGNCTPRTDNTNCLTYDTYTDACLTCSADAHLYYSDGKCLDNTAENCATTSALANECATCPENYQFDSSKGCTKCAEGKMGENCAHNIVDCQNGEQQEDGTCLCNGNFATDSLGVCTVCAEGWDDVSNNCETKVLDCSENNSTGWSYDEHKCICNAGWIGDTCEAPAGCGEEFKFEGGCTRETHYQVGEPCQAGDTFFYHCEARGDYAYHCEEFNDNDTCQTCKDGYDTIDGGCQLKNGYIECSNGYGCKEIKCGIGGDQVDNSCVCREHFVQDNDPEKESWQQECNTCETGWEDPESQCQYEILECQNGGTWNHTTHACDCTPSWTGTVCEICVKMGSNGECAVLATNQGVNNDEITLSDETKIKDDDGVDKVLDMIGVYNSDKSDDSTARNADGAGKKGSITITRVGSRSKTSNAYGVYAESNQRGYNAVNGATGTIDINTTSVDKTGKSYGVYADGAGKSYNASGSGSKGTITITNKGMDQIFGVYTGSGEAHNAHDGGTGDINLEIGENGSLAGYGSYGVYAEGAGTVYNAAGTGSTGTITIKNRGYGDVYGLYTGAGKAYNAHSGGHGIIDIDAASEEETAAYGIYAASGEAYNASGEDSVGEITIKKAKTIGDIFGMYIDEGTGYNAHEGAQGSITLEREAYIDNADYDSNGIYANNGTIYNAFGADSQGNITIRNKARGYVYGLHVNTKGDVYNAEQGAQGTITIENNVNNSSTVYGVYTNEGDIYNANGESSVGLIQITDTTSSARAHTIHGLYNKKGNIYNAKDGAQGTISIKTDGAYTGSGMVRGAYTEGGTIYNATGSSTTGIVDIISKADGSYTVAGLFAKAGDGDTNDAVYNAHNGGTGSVSLKIGKVAKTQNPEEEEDEEEDREEYSFSGTAYGIGAESGNVYNASGTASIGTVDIAINAQGAYTVYGMYAGNGSVYNSTNGGKGSVTLTLEEGFNSSDSATATAYGLGSNTGNIYNVSGDGLEGTVDITVNSTGNYTVYGLSALTSGDIYNVNGDGSTGNITILSGGTDLYGLYTGDGSIYNVNGASSTGTLTITSTNATASLYGLYSKGTGAVYNAKGGNGTITLTGGNSISGLRSTKGDIYNATGNGVVGTLIITPDEAKNRLQRLYGLYAETSGSIYNANEGAQASISITAAGTYANNSLIHGAYTASGDVFNANGEDSVGTVDIVSSAQGNYTVSGLSSLNGQVANASEGGNGTVTIKIGKAAQDGDEETEPADDTFTFGGTVYGLYTGTGDIYNAKGDSTTGKLEITVDAEGEYSVYGLSAMTSGDIYNVDGSGSTGTVSITSGGTNLYGLYTGNGSIYNVNGASSTGTLTITSTNDAATLYGLYSKGTGTIYNAKDGTGTITLTGGNTIYGAQIANGDIYNASGSTAQGSIYILPDNPEEKAQLLYGLYVTGKGDIYNAHDGGNGLISMTAGGVYAGNNNVIHAMYTKEGSITNAVGEGAEGTVTVESKAQGRYTVSGMYAMNEGDGVSGNLVNAQEGGNGSISITVGDESNPEFEFIGNVYGMYTGAGDISNATGDDTTGEVLISVNAKENYNIYGLYSKGAGDIYNVNGVRSNGTITITASGNNEIYGLYTGLGSIYNAYGDGSNGNISITGKNTIYGLHSVGGGDMYNASGAGAEGSITIIGTTLTSNTEIPVVYGLYSKGAGGNIVNAEKGGHGSISVQGSNTISGVRTAAGNITNATGADSVGSIEIINTATPYGTLSVYGLYVEGTGDIVNAVDGGNGTFSLTSSGSLTNNTGNVIYGAYTKQGTIKNATGEGSVGETTISLLASSGRYTAYGFYTGAGSIYNAEDGATGTFNLNIGAKESSGGYINNSTIYGMHTADGDVYNATGDGSTGTLNISGYKGSDSTNNYTVYGLITDKGSVYNAQNGATGDINLSFVNGYVGTAHGMYATAAGYNATGKGSTGTIDIQSATGTVYGLYVTNGEAYNAVDEATGNVFITTEKTSTSTSGSVYGIRGSGNAYNASGANSTGSITIDRKNRYGTVTGVVANSGTGYNAFNGGQGTITITTDVDYYSVNDSYGSTTGISGSTVYNATGAGSIGKITIDKTGYGSVYAISGTNAAYNAANSGNGTITITTKGHTSTSTVNNTTAAVYSSSGNAYNVYDNSATGTISVSLGGYYQGYAVYGYDSAYNAHNAGDFSGKSVLIKLTNTANGTLYGVAHSRNDNNNSYNAYNAYAGQAIANGTIEITSSGSGTTVGVSGVRAYNVGAYDYEGKGFITGNSSSGTVYGVSATAAYNAYSGNKKATGEITFNNTGSGSVYGVRASSNGYNAYANSFEAEGIIRVGNTSTATSGSAYGMGDGTSNGTLYNAYSNNAVATGKIYGTGDGSASTAVYGMSGYKVYNAFAYRAASTGLIEIESQGAGNVFGIQGTTTTTGSEVVNAYVDQTTANGTIKITHSGTGGNLYGIGGSSSVSWNVKTSSVDRSNDNSDTATGRITIDNTGTAGEIWGTTGGNVYTYSAPVEGYITLTNKGTASKLYGALGDNLFVEGSRSITATSEINIDNSGRVNGDVTGVGGRNVTAKSNSQDTFTGLIEINNTGTITGTVTGSVGANSSNQLNVSVTKGQINITNDEGGSIGTIIGSRYTNADSVSSNGYITITNKSGTVQNIFGVYHTVKDDPSLGVGGKETYYYNARGSGSHDSERNTDPTGEITILNESTVTGNIYGIRGPFWTYNDSGADAEGIINITSTGTVGGTIYGVYADTVAQNEGVITINSQEAQGGIAGAFANSIQGTAYNAGEQGSTANINITKTGAGDVYGLKSNGKVHIDGQVFQYGAFNTNTKGTGTIDITINDGETSANAFGVYAEDGEVGNAGGAASTAKILITNNSNGNSFGLFGTVVGNKSNIVNDETQDQVSIIEITNGGTGTAIGTYSTESAINSGDITIHNLGDGSAIGMYVKSGTAENAGTITIDRASAEKGGNAYGIYAASGTTVTNSGKIIISGANNSYGIYAEDSDVEVINEGTITIDGTSCEGGSCSETVGGDNQTIALAAAQPKKAYIYLNGGKLFQNGNLISSTDINLDDFNGKVIASNKSSFATMQSMSGDLYLDNSIVENGFDTEYRVDEMIYAKDTAKLNLKSQSALFEASLENDTDVVMKMKAFDSVVSDSKIAAFLQENYAAQNNEMLYATLKAAATKAELNSDINAIFGKKILSRMTFEDLSMMREVAFNLKDKMLDNDKTYFSYSGNANPTDFDKNTGSQGRWALSGKTDGRESFGLGLSISDVRSSDRESRNSRFDRSFVVSTPYGYKHKGWEFVTAPEIGYALGTYDRRGLNSTSFDGKMEKRMAALMNEVRYPIAFKGIKLVPSAELNMIGYHLKGHEEDKAFSLRIKSQQVYSVEAGFGITASKEIELPNKAKLGVMAGLAYYHEFANPYDIKVGMEGMNGSVRLHDDRYGDNRVAVRLGANYRLSNDIDISAYMLSNVNKDTQTDARLSLKFKF